MIKEIKRVIKESEIMKYGFPSILCFGGKDLELTHTNREDDAKWPQKNKDGRQELEIRLGNEHISFEVSNQALHCLRFDPSVSKKKS